MNEATKNIGSLFVTVSGSGRSVAVPMTFEAYVALDTVQRSRDGKIMKADTLFTARYDARRTSGISFDDVIGNPVVLDSINTYLGKLGHLGRVTWAAMNQQEPGILEFRMKPFMVDELFPEYAEMQEDELAIA